MYFVLGKRQALYTSQKDSKAKIMHETHDNIQKICCTAGCVLKIAGDAERGRFTKNNEHLLKHIARQWIYRPLHSIAYNR